MLGSANFQQLGQFSISGNSHGQLGSFCAAPHIRSGRLIPLLVQHIARREGIYLYYGHRTELALRVRTFIEFAIERIANNQEFFLTPQELLALPYRPTMR